MANSRIYVDMLPFINPGDTPHDCTRLVLSLEALFMTHFLPGRLHITIPNGFLIIDDVDKMQAFARRLDILGRHQGELSLVEFADMIDAHARWLTDANAPGADTKE